MLILLFACTPQATPDTQTPDTDSAADTSAADTSEADTGEADTFPAVDLTLTGFSSPESILYDATGDRYLVSNIQGNAGEDDGDGFISVVTPEGTIESLRWISSPLSAPKGMAIDGDRLYVADLDAVEVFERATGTWLESIALPTGRSNDVTIGPDGALYVTERIDVIVYRIEDGMPVVLASGEALGEPNGIVGYPDGLLVLDSTGRVLQLDLDGQITVQAELPSFPLDGILLHPDHTLLVSCWGASAIYAVDDSESVVLLSDLSSPADIGLDTLRDRLLVPQMITDQIRIITLP